VTVLGDIFSKGRDFPDKMIGDNNWWGKEYDERRVSAAGGDNVRGLCVLLFWFDYGAY
jgi:hypothetical protein